MATKNLSAREAEIVALSTQGLTNEAIALKLGVSIGTVNTYWTRIKFKTGGAGRTDTVARIVAGRAELVLREANADHAGIESVIQAGIDELIRERDSEAFVFRAALEMLDWALERIGAEAWAVDTELRLRYTAGRESTLGIPANIGQTLYNVFDAQDASHPCIAAHLAALQGQTSDVDLGPEFRHAHLRTAPFLDVAGGLLGCVTLIEAGGPHPNSPL